MSNCNRALTCAGLRDLHSLTSGGDMELRVDLRDWDGNTASAVYSNFRVGGADSNYRLTYGSFHGGDAGQLLMGRRTRRSRRRRRSITMTSLQSAADLHVPLFIMMVMLMMKMMMMILIAIVMLIITTTMMVMMKKYSLSGALA